MSGWFSALLYRNMKQRAEAIDVTGTEHQMVTRDGEIPGNGQVVDPAIAATSGSDGTSMSSNK